MRVTKAYSWVVVDVLAASAVAFAQAESPAVDEKKGLVGSVAERLGLSEASAEAGTAAIISYAKKSLGDQEFGVLSKALPEVDGILQRAGALQIDSLGDLTKHLEALGIEGGAIKSFAPAVIDYVQETTGVSKAKLLRKAMSLRSAS